MEYLYVCHFSNGHIKVGRSIDPKARIAVHVDRVACVGIELVEHRTFKCVGQSAPAEAELIERCTQIASKRNKSEWFEGLDYLDVVLWAQDCSIKKCADQMNLKDNAHRALLLAIEAAGGQAALAKQLTGVAGQSTVGNWVMRGNGAPIEYCAGIELCTGIVRRELCPESWGDIWPELINDQNPWPTPAATAPEAIKTVVIY